MANVHGFNDFQNNRPNQGPLRDQMLGDNTLNQEIKMNRVPLMNNLQSDRPPLQQTIPYTLKLIWCPTLTLLTFTSFMLISIWVLYIVCLTQGIDQTHKLVLAPSLDTLLKFGAINKSNVQDGQVWRFITAAFLHVDLLHIVMNSISLLFFLSRLEKCYNFRIMILFGLFSAILGNIASAYFNAPNIISAGASSIIYGTFGGLVAYMTINWGTLGRLRSQLCCIIGILIVISILMSFDSSVDLAGHIGGLVGGYFSGLLLFPGIKPKDKKISILGVSGLGISLLVLLLLLYI